MNAQMFDTMKDLGGQYKNKPLVFALLLIPFLPHIKLVDSVGGEDSKAADRDEDNAGPESLAQGGEVEMDVVSQTDHQLTADRQEPQQDLSQSQLVDWVVAQPALQHQQGRVSSSPLPSHLSLTSLPTLRLLSSPGARCSLLLL